MSLEQGTIISFKDNFGFIKNKEGVIHYFNNRLLKNKQEWSFVKVGMNVNFESFATSKGMSAKNVVLKYPLTDKIKSPIKKQTYKGYVRGERFIIGGKNFVMNKNFLSNYKFFYTGRDKSLEVAKEEAEYMARRMGANYLIYTDHETHKEQDGNYIYRTHQFSCTCGVYFVPHQFDTEEEAQASLIATQEYVNKPFCHSTYEGTSISNKIEENKKEQPKSVFGTLVTAALISIFIK